MLQGKVAVVTGASRGIGAAIALTLAKYGASVLVNYYKSESKANAMVEDLCSRYGVRALAFQADVANERAVQDMIDFALDQFGKIDILVNNAGEILLPQYWLNVSKDVWNRSLDVNLFGVLNCIRSVVPHMRKQNGGKIVNITSTYGMIGSPFVPAYVIAKAGVITLTKSLARELAPNITINAVAPGNIDTEMTTNAGQDIVAQVINATPLQRLGTPIEVAEAVCFLCSSAADFVTGEVFVIDGGHMLR